MTGRLTIKPDVLIREIGGESVLLDVERGTYFGLNGMGTRMWTALTTSDSVQAAYQSLLAEYDVDAQVLSKDLDDLVAKLVEHGLVELS